MKGIETKRVDSQIFVKAANLGPVVGRQSTTKMAFLFCQQFHLFISKDGIFVSPKMASFLSPKMAWIF